MVIKRDKPIGNVLYIVEGASTEFYLLKKIFGEIFGYQIEVMPNGQKYKKYNEKYQLYKAISLLSISLIDLGLIE